MSDRISRRDFIKNSLGVAGALSAPTIINYLGKSSPSSDKEFLEVRDGNFYLGGDEYMIKGANYKSRDHPWELFEEWGPKEVKKELDLAEDLGVNALRVAINYQFSTNNVDWAKPFSHTEIDDDYLKSFDEFLEIADTHGMKVMPILFDQFYWTVYKEGKRKYAKDYLKRLISPFSEDERVLAWDLKNEPDLNFDEIGKEKSISFLREISDEVKDLDDNHPITIGYGDPGPLLETAADVDFQSFHHYEFPYKLAGIFEKIRKTTDKPIVLEEFGLPTLESSEVWPHSEEDQKDYYEKTFQKLVNFDINGAMFWCLLDSPEELLKKDKNPFLPEDEFQYHTGIFRTNYSKKPAAHVVEQYYKWFL